MSEFVSGVLWRRIDRPGHDLCHLLREPKGWRLTGHAIFDDGAACSLNYDIVCDADWKTTSARIAGSIDRRPVELMIAAESGRWTMGGQALPELDGLVDIDLGFTPATNILPLRRLLAGNTETKAEAAWLPFPDFAMQRLMQVYRRIDDEHVAYASPTHDFEATLTVSTCGFVLDYPALWTGREIEP